jgi:aspartate 1-decarboxylase
MKRTFLLSKLHNAKVTGADLYYEGSFGIDRELMEAAGILENEQVHVYNISNGKRFSTYAIPAERGSRIMCANGACAHLVTAGDRVIICTYVALEEKEYKNFNPTVLFLDEKNNFTIKSKVLDRNLEEAY